MPWRILKKKHLADMLPVYKVESMFSVHDSGSSGQGHSWQVLIIRVRSSQRRKNFIGCVSSVYILLTKQLEIQNSRVPNSKLQLRAVYDCVTSMNWWIMKLLSLTTRRCFRLTKPRQVSKLLFTVHIVFCPYLRHELFRTLELLPGVHNCL